MKSSLPLMCRSPVFFSNAPKFLGVFGRGVVVQLFSGYFFESLGDFICCDVSKNRGDRA
jgi:hypothetical protein